MTTSNFTAYYQDSLPPQKKSRGGGGQDHGGALVKAKIGELEGRVGAGCSIRITVYTMAPLWNSPFDSVHGNYFGFSCQSGVLRIIDPPSKSRTNWRWLSRWNFVEVGVCGLGAIRCVILSMEKDKKYLHHNWMDREYRDSLQPPKAVASMRSTLPLGGATTRQEQTTRPITQKTCQVLQNHNRCNTRK